MAALYIFIFTYAIQAAASQLRNPSIIPGLTRDSCPPSVQTESLREELSRNISIITHDWIRTHCGTATGWTRIAYLNMTDPNQQCPANWREYSLYGQRLCGRLYIQSDWRCDGNFYSTMGMLYTQICGRIIIIGYRFDDPDGYTGSRHEQSINTAYVDGVSLTYGNPRNHIWSFYGGQYENQCNNRSKPKFLQLISMLYRFATASAVCRGLCTIVLHYHNYCHGCATTLTQNSIVTSLQIFFLHFP